MRKRSPMAKRKKEEEKEETRTENSNSLSGIISPPQHAHFIAILQLSRNLTLHKYKEKILHAMYRIYEIEYSQSSR